MSLFFCTVCIFNLRTRHGFMWIGTVKWKKKKKKNFAAFEKSITLILELDRDEHSGDASFFIHTISQYVHCFSLKIRS